MKCLECGNYMVLRDATFSNIIAKGVGLGQHTGDIYYCEECEKHYLDNLLSGYLEPYHY